MAEPARPASLPQDDRKHFLLLSVLSFLILFVPLHRGDLSGYDDAVYAHEAKEMIRTGDWWNVRFNGYLNFEYPPGFMWLEALSMTLLGMSDFAAKVPAALAGFGTIVVVYFLARELTEEPWIPRLAMWVLVSTQYFMRYATHAMTDVPFTFFFALAILFYVRGLRAERYLVLAGLPLACGLMTRSVIGLIPIAIIFAHILITRRYQIIFSRQLFLLLAIAFSLPVVWFALEYRFYGMHFLQSHASFVLSKVHGADPSPARNEILQLLEYPKFLLQRYWPWLPFMALGFYKQGRAAISRRDSSAVLLVLWVLLVVVPFSLAETKVLRYILPAFPAFAILSAGVLNEWIPQRRKVQLFKALYALGFVFVLYAAVFPMTLLRATDMLTLAPVAEAHSAPQERVLLYTYGELDWSRRNQFVWYGNRYVELVTDLAEVESRLASGRNTVVVIDKEAAGRLRAALGDGQPEAITVLAQSENFVCLKYAAPAG